MLTNILFLYYIALRHVNMNYNLTKAQTNRYFMLDIYDISCLTPIDPIIMLEIYLFQMS